MIELFKAIIDIQTPFNMIVLVTLFGCAAGVLGAIAKEIRKYACHRQDIAFKQDLIDRGLGPEEIERIVKVRPDQPVEQPTTVIEKQ
jgi:hypothetical protein